MPMPEHLQGKAVPISKQPNRGKGAGRKPKLVRKWIKECNISKEDARIMLNSILHTRTLKDLNQLRKTEYDRVSAATYTMISAMEKAARKGDFSALREMYDFIYGKDEQKISLTNLSPGYIEIKDELLRRAENEKSLGEETILALANGLAKAVGGEIDGG